MPQDTGGILNLKKPVGSDDIRLQTIGIDLPYNYQKIDDAFTAHLAEEATQNKLGHVKTPEEPIQLTLQNGWQHAMPNLTYYKDSFGRVYLQGEIQNGTYADGTIIGELPAGYRPGRNMRDVGIRTNDASLFTYSITTYGIIYIYGLSAQSRIAFNTSFRVGQ